MPAYKRFEDLPVWRDAARLYELVSDLLEMRGVPLSYGFRSQLDRAALSVSNNIAEGFERFTTGELLSFLAIARGSAGEVRSMIAVAQRRPRLAPQAGELQRIRSVAESCSRQIAAWAESVENSPVQGRRHLTDRQRQARRAGEAEVRLRQEFFRGLKPDHALYNSPEAQAARGETREDSR